MLGVLRGEIALARSPSKSRQHSSEGWEVYWLQAKLPKKGW